LNRLRALLFAVTLRATVGNTSKTKFRQTSATMQTYFAINAFHAAECSAGVWQIKAVKLAFY